MVKTVTVKRQPREGGGGDHAKYKVKKNGKLDTGRPTKKTQDVLDKLKYAFMRNCTEAEASAYAEISYDTLNKWKAEDPEFIKQIKAWRDMYVQAIKFVSYDRAMDSKNKDSTEILFKVDKSYSDKIDADIKGEISLVDIAKKMQQKRLDQEQSDLSN